MQPDTQRPPTPDDPKTPDRRRSGEDALRLWSVSLAVPLSIETALSSMLRDDERRRAEQFRFPRHRRRFVVRRAALRAILAGVLGCQPRDVPIAVEQTFGRPFLAIPDAPAFSTSHSGETGLVALGPGARAARFAVDIEETRPLDDFRPVARRFFAAEEIVAVDAARDEAAALVRFYRTWVAKEAFVKALGRGLSHALDSFAVDVGETPQVIRADGEDPEAWSVRLFEPHPGAVAALVASPRAMLAEGLPQLDNWSPAHIP